MLINFKDIAFDKEEVKEIYLFKTSLIGNQIKLIEPMSNLIKNRIIDYDDFKKNNSKYYFSNLDFFYNFIETI